MSFSRDTIRRVFVGVAATPKGNYTNCKSRTQVHKCENSTRVVFSRSPGTEIYSSFDTPLGSFTGEDGVLIPPKELGHSRRNVARQLHGMTSRRASSASAARKRRGRGSCLTLFSKNCFCDTFYLL